ncbi:MAG: sigma-54 dependent transcriptional regulator [bacterium]
MFGTILIVEDEKIMRITLEDFLKSKGFEVYTAEKIYQAIEIFNKKEIDCIITDVKLPDGDGITFLEEIKKKNPDIPVVVITAYGTIKMAVSAMKAGAFDYITKPFSLDEFLIILERAFELKRIKEENVNLRKKIDNLFSPYNIIGESKKIKEICEIAYRIADLDSTVLITGETGTGKELVANIIHYSGKRKDKPFIKINCSAIPAELMESELFGYEKGAFTGATSKKLGKFELANGGTLFLDEIGDIPLSLQPKLLRVLQDKVIERIGGIGSIKVEVRIISATNKDLLEEVKKGNFREDLYYRLSVIPIYVPPLRERKEDIPYLVEHFLKKYNSRFGKNVRLSRELMTKFFDYDFPGNVRELENMIERLVALANNNEELGVEALNSNFVKSERSFSSDILPLEEYISKVEKEYIHKVLSLCDGNKTKAAELLGISRKNLWEKLKEG